MKLPVVLLLAVIVLPVPFRPKAAGGINAFAGVNKITLMKDSTLPVASFRIVFGVHDQRPRLWSGKITQRPNQHILVEADKFRDYQYEKKSWSGGIISIKLPDPVLPNDYLTDSLGWICSTRFSPLHGPTTEWHDYGLIDSLYGNKILEPVIVHPSIIINLLTGDPNEKISVNTINGDFSFNEADLLKTGLASYLGGAIRVELVPKVRQVSQNPSAQQDFPSVMISNSGTTWLAWQEYNGQSDQLVVRSKSAKGWSRRYVLAKDADIFHTAIAEGPLHRIWVTWSMQADGRWDIYGRYFDGKKWSGQIRITNGNTTKNIFHSMVASPEGMWMVWQGSGQGFSQIYAKNFDGQRWSVTRQLSDGPSSEGNNWDPFICSGPEGSLAVAWDGYASGNYDIYLKRFDGAGWQKEERITGTPQFEAHPTVAISKDKKTWIAWDESGANWGKDGGFLLGQKGTALHNSRSIRVVCLQGKRQLTTEGDLTTVLGDGFWELPYLQLDNKGFPHLLVRHLIMREPDTPLEGPVNLALWEVMVTGYDGKQWTRPMYIPESRGRNDMRPATALDREGNIWSTWATDSRDTKDYQPQQLIVELGSIPAIGRHQEMSLKEVQPETKDSAVILDPHEKEDVQRIRNYRIEVNGKKYSIFRGDLHRHTDISVDGNNDGSLEDAYRYAKDAASLDFLGITNHTDDIWDEYNWWRSQKTADLFNINNSFVDFYAYERSVEWPNGHRNVFFIRRGVPILPIGAFEARAGYVGTETLYSYLKRYHGFCIAHTTGRTSGTDWRDNNPKVESVVEIYQGMRDSYEYPESPRPFKLFSLPDTSKPIPRASSASNSPSFKKLGFVWNALAKGYKLGFIASSDHISTHISYANVIAEKLTRKSLMDAILKRRTYASTDNIIMDIRYRTSQGIFLMGDITNSSSAIRIDGKIIGTSKIAQIDLIKNNTIVSTYYPKGQVFNLDYQDLSYKDRKKNYYYVRVIQKDGNMAWGSPCWITYQ